jgi:hypothetical protein
MGIKFYEKEWLWFSLPFNSTREWRIPKASFSTCPELKCATSKGKFFEWLSPVPSCPNDPSPHMKSCPESAKMN